MRRALSLIGLLFTLIVVSASEGRSAQSVEDAKALLNAGHYLEAPDYRQARQSYEKSVSCGANQARNLAGEAKNLREIYRNSWGVAQDDAHAWFERRPL